MLSRIQDFTRKYTILVIFFEIITFFTITLLIMNEISPVSKYDENAYLDHVRTILLSENYWYLGDRNRMPIFNYFLSLFYDLNLNELKNYYNLKIANLALTSFLSMLFFLKLNKKFQNKFIFINFSFFVLVIPIFALVHQLLVESIFFISFCLMLVYFDQFYDEPSSQNAIKLGFAGAFCYLLKYTGLTVFFAISLFTVIFGLLNKKTIYIKRFIIVFFTFFILVSPYLYENYTNFNNHIFYNVNSEFYFWADSWEEIVDGVRANNDRVGWPTMEDSELPSFEKYVSEHSFSDVYNRFLFGFKSIGVDYFNLSKLGSHITIISISVLMMSIYLAYKGRVFYVLKLSYFDLITILTSGFIILASAFNSYISIGLRYTLPIGIPLFLMVFLKLDKVYARNNIVEFRHILVFFTSLNIFILANSYLNLLP
jgi:hypothetical protein